MKDFILPEDLVRSREQALKLSKYGSLEGKIPVKVDKRTVAYKKICTK